MEMMKKFCHKSEVTGFYLMIHIIFSQTARNLFRMKRKRVKRMKTAVMRLHYMFLMIINWHSTMRIRLLNKKFRISLTRIIQLISFGKLKLTDQTFTKIKSIEGESSISLNRKL